MPDVPSDAEQQAEIAEELGVADDTQFLRFLAAVWSRYDYLQTLPAGLELRRLYVTRRGIQKLMGQNWQKRDIRMGTVYRHDSQIMKGLTMMLAAIEDEINVIVGRTQTRPAATGGILAGTIIRGAPGDPTRGTT